MSKGRKIALLGVMLGVMFVLSLAEGLIPPILPPFGRIGLPNIVVLYALLCIGHAEAGVLVLLKAGFAFLTRGATAGLLSLSGGLLSFGFAIVYFYLFKKRSTVALGVTGAVAHNIGQLAAFSILAQTNVITFYLPVMLIAGIVTGFATGTVFRLTLPSLRRIGAMSLCLIVLLTGCSSEDDARSHKTFDGPFNTVTAVTMYDPNAEELTAQIEEMAWELHRLFDIYHDYEGIANLKTINDNAGISPVAVDPIIIEMLTFGKEAYTETDGAVNIAMGAVLRLWHEARETGVLPETGALTEAAKYCDIESLVIDPAAGTVFITDPDVRLDVGAVAKGFAAQKIIGAFREKGITDLLLDMGGNVVGYSSGEDSWRVGIRDPRADNKLVQIASVKDGAVVSSGGYERYVVIGGESYHHIIDPWTLQPANRYLSVTVVHTDSAIADMLSTALFILPKEEGELLAERFGAEIVYIE